MGVLDISCAIAFIGLMIFLRRDKKYFNVISTTVLSVGFLFFTAIILILEDSQSKMLWYALFIVSSFLIKGYRFGLYATLTTIATMYILKIVPFVDLHVEDKDLILATATYICIALFSAYTAIAHEKNIENLKKSNLKVQKQKFKLHSQLRTNPLTKLSNQYALEEHLKKFKNDISLIIIEVDSFDTITSEFGKVFSNEITKQIHQRLDKLTSKDFLLYHLFTSRFAFVVKNHTHNKDINFMNSIKSIFESESIKYQDIDISITFSAGIARGNSEKIIIQANTALSDIQTNWENGYKLFENSQEYEKQQTSNLYWAKRIKEIIIEDNLIVYYQPIINNKTQKVEKYECLVRAVDNDAIIPPYIFLEVAQKTGYLQDITHAVIEKSFQVFQNKKFNFSINITNEDLQDSSIIKFLQQKIRQYHIDPSNVYFEVLENINISKSNKSVDILKKLKDIGFKISIDDFGTESSNFSRILTIDADVIKIDGSFIKNLDTDKSSVKIVETIVSFAKKIEASTVAEFVHNEEIFNIVKELGVDYSQGYYFSPPLPQIQDLPLKNEIKTQIC
jgi:diguanylate cyclase (GGDEF)-like protein